MIQDKERCVARALTTPWVLNCYGYLSPSLVAGYNQVRELWAQLSLASRAANGLGAQRGEFILFKSINSGSNLRICSAELSVLAPNPYKWKAFMIIVFIYICLAKPKPCCEDMPKKYHHFHPCPACKLAIKNPHPPTPIGFLMVFPLSPSSDAGSGITWSQQPSPLAALWKPWSSTNRARKHGSWCRTCTTQVALFWYLKVEKHCNNMGVWGKSIWAKKYQSGFTNWIPHLCPTMRGLSIKKCQKVSLFLQSLPISGWLSRLKAPFFMVQPSFI